MRITQSVLSLRIITKKGRKRKELNYNLEVKAEKKKKGRRG